MTAGIDRKILKRLKSWESKEGPLSKPLEFYRKLLTVQSSVQRRINVPEISLNQEAANDRINNGRPLLEHKDFFIDFTLLKDAYKTVSTLFSSYLKEQPEITAQLQATPTNLEEITQAWFSGAKLPLPGKIDDITEATWELVIHGTVKPFLAKYSEALYSLIPQEFWRRSYCPVCGGSPDFAYLDKERGSRWLLCSRCDAEWIFQRLECPFCTTRNQSALAYFSDDSGLYRLYVCEECHHYVKAIDLRQTEKEVLLPLERLLTTDMDIQAQEKGYKPPARMKGKPGTKRNG